MPAIKSLSKANKIIQKAKGAIHPKGRKLKQLNRASLRETKLVEKKQKFIEKREAELQRVAFLQQAIKNRDYQETFSLDEIKLFIDAFISRDDEEIEQLVHERRKGRPPTNRQLLLENKRKHEQSEFDSGFKVPDLTNAKSVEALKAWNGTFGGLNTVTFVHIARNSDAISNHHKVDVDKMEE